MKLWLNKEVGTYRLIRIYVMLMSMLYLPCLMSCTLEREERQWEIRRIYGPWPGFVLSIRQPHNPDVV